MGSLPHASGKLLGTARQPPTGLCGDAVGHLTYLLAPSIARYGTVGGPLAEISDFLGHEDRQRAGLAHFRQEIRL